MFMNLAKRNFNTVVLFICFIHSDSKKTGKGQRYPRLNTSLKNQYDKPWYLIHIHNRNMASLEFKYVCHRFNRCATILSSRIVNK